MQHNYRYPLIGFGVSLLLLPMVTQAAYNWRASFAAASKPSEITIGQTDRVISDTRINLEGVEVKKPKQSMGDRVKASIAVHTEVVRQRIDETTYASKADIVLNNVSIENTRYVGKEKINQAYNFSDLIRLRTITKDGASYIQIADMSRGVCVLITRFVGPCEPILNQWIRIEDVSSVTDSSLGRLVAADTQDINEESIKKISDNEKLKKIPILQPLRLVKTFTGEDGATYAVIESKISQTFVNTALAEYRKTAGTQDPVTKAEMNETIRHLNTFVAQSRILLTINTESNAVSSVELKGKLSGSFYNIEAIRNKAKKVIGAKRVADGTRKLDIFNTSIIERNVFDEITVPEFSRSIEEYMNYVMEGTTTAQDNDLDRLYDADELRFFGTDPNKADSDGDGFDDLEELTAGYNPNGEGR